MDLVVLLSQSAGSNTSLFWPFLVVFGLAIVIWLLSWLLFPDPEVTPAPETLQGLTGLTGDVAAKLRQFGVRTDQDLMRLTPRALNSLSAELGLNDGELEKWRSEIRNRWRRSYLPAEFRESDLIQPDPALGGLFTKAPAKYDDLTKLAGVDHTTANRMNAAGIYTFEQLRLMTPEQKANLKNQFRLSGFQFESVPSWGVTIEGLRHLQPDAPVTAVEVAESVASTPHGEANTKANTDIANSPAASVSSDTALAAEVGGPVAATHNQVGSNSLTADSPAEVAEQIPAGQTGAPSTSTRADAKLPNASAGSDAEEDGYQIPKSKIDDDLGRLYSSPPPHRDDLTCLDGIDEGTANRLNAAGIYTTDQLLSLSPTQQQKLRTRFSLNNIDFAKWRHAQSAVSSVTPSTSSEEQAQSALAPNDLENAGTTSPENHLDIGYVYLTPPLHPDDLTELSDINADRAKRLNEAGIYRFHQLQTMSEQQRQNFQRSFGLDNLDWDSWMRTFSQTTQPASSHTASDQRQDSSSINEITTSSQQQTQSKPPTGAVGFASGIPADTDARGGGSSSSTDSAESSDEEESVGVAFLQPTEPPTKRSKYGLVYETQPDVVSELSKLYGISDSDEAKLNGVGIYSYAQLKALSASELELLRTDLQLGEIDFVDWRRCIHAWSRGIHTTAKVEKTFRNGWLHGIRLPEVAKGVFDGKQLVAYPEQVVFRGSRPEMWGQALSQPDDNVTRSIAGADVRSDINYVRIRRTDTRESVVTAITKAQLFGAGPKESNGWNGQCEPFFGGHHLGIFAKDIPQEVETRFGIGGWGFGHRYDHNDQQEWGWAGRLIEPTTFEISVGHIGKPSGTVVFRSNDPTIWNQRVKSGSDHFAMPIHAVTHPIQFLRLQRVDSGEAVIIRVTREEVLSRSENPRLGWNGLADEFSGGHHLGIYHRDMPQAVEISFGEGGWGFGHPYDENNRQAFGWAGQSIGIPTVFEISLLEHLPDYLRHELIE